jgi:hypothetical protein
VYIFLFVKDGVTTRHPAPVGDGLRITWLVLVGAGSGAIAGLAIGGLGGRLAMLLLRLTSSDFVVGLTSDDGFEIGVVSTRTFELLLLTTAAGAVNGILYAALRGGVPARLRLPLWTAVAAAGGGAIFVHEDGIDFTLLEPVALAIALFVLLPGSAAAVVVLLVERWSGREPWGDIRLSAGLCVSALAATFALVLAAAFVVVAIAAHRVGLGERGGQVARVLVPAGLAVVTVLAAWSLVTESARLL